MSMICSRLTKASGGTPQKARQTGGSRRPGKARPEAVCKSRASGSAENRCRVGSRSTLTNLTNWAEGNRFANPQEHLLAALNACMTVGYVAQCAVRGITLESLEIETDGKIDPRGFLGIDSAVAPGYESLNYIVRIKGSGTRQEYVEIHEAVMATSPSFYNLSRPVALNPTLVVM